MNDEIQTSPQPLQLGKCVVHGSQIFDVAGQHEIGSQRGGERSYTLAERLTLIGEGKLGLMRRKRPGNTPGDGVVIGHTHDQTTLAVHQAVHAALTPPQAGSGSRAVSF